MITAPGDARQRYGTLLGRLIDSGQWERALAVARDWLAEEPDLADAHLAAGQALVNLGQHGPALPHLQRVLAARPGHTFTHRLASIACAGLDRRADAERHVEEAIRLAPRDAMNWYHLALMRYRQGAHEAAAKHVRHVLALAPNNADAINLLALCERTDPERQLAGYHRALELDPENAIVHNNLGVYHLNVDRDYGRAADCFRHALSLNPTDKLAQNNLRLALREYDPVYKVLRWPLSLASGVPVGRGRKGQTRRVTPVAFGAAFGGAFLLVVGACLVFCFPLLKGYERLTLDDLQRQYGAPGTRRGGPLGFWRWPRWVRTALYLTAYVAAWAGLVWGLSFWDSGGNVLVIIFALAVGLFFLNGLRVSLRDAYRRSAAKRSEKRFQRRLGATLPPDP